MSSALHVAKNAHGTPGPFLVREEQRPGDESRITIQASTGLVLAELSGYCAAERRTLAHQFSAVPELIAAAECGLALTMTPTSEGYEVLRRHGFQHNPDLREADFSQACAFVDSLCRIASAKATGAAS